jgi:hypothetical protein
VTRHLAPSDHRRRQLEQLGRRVGVCSPGDAAEERLPTAEQQRALVAAESLTIATASRAAGSAALREQMRLRSFRNVLIVATVLLTLLAATLCLIGLRSPTSLPLCFAPEQQDGSTLVVCPTAQTTVDTSGGGHGGRPPRRADRPGRRGGRRRGGGAQPARLLRTARHPGRGGPAEAADGGPHGGAGPAARARPVLPGPDRSGHLGADPGVGPGLRLRAAAVHPAGRRAGRHRPEQRPCRQRDRPRRRRRPGSGPVAPRGPAGGAPVTTRPGPPGRPARAAPPA